MEKKKSKSKIIILTSVIVGVLVVLLGLTYAIFSYSRLGSNGELVLGEIYMHYTETNVFSLDNAFPTETYNPAKFFEFTINGKNTHEVGGILYNIQVTHGDENASKTRIDDNHLKFRLVEVNDDNTETVLVDGESYETLNNTTMYSNIIPKNTTTEVEYKYRVYVWISDEVTIGNTEDVEYTMEEWANLYANVKINVTGEYVEGEVFSTKIKSKVGTEGLVAVNTNGELYDATDTTQTIREYRYSGLGNYCTYTDGTNDYNLNVKDNTCPQTACAVDQGIGAPFIINGNNEGFSVAGITCETMGGTTLNQKVANSVPTDSGLRNYVEFNGELWRIVGVFGENVKIMKDEPLLYDAYSEETYTSGDTTYKLKYIEQESKYGYFRYKQLSDDSYNNDWTTSGVMHYLNDTTENSYYTRHLSNFAKNMIQETTYYLGNVNSNTTTPSGFYTEERGNVVCADTVTSNSHESNCNIWYGNQATWTGDISLIYPSDYMYATPTTGWNLTMENIGELLTTFRESWMSNPESDSFWWLSPSSSYPVYVWFWDCGGVIGYTTARYDIGLRPSLNLKSSVVVVSGDGSYSNPYKLIG